MGKVVMTVAANTGACTGTVKFTTVVLARGGAGALINTSTQQFKISAFIYRLTKQVQK